MIVCLEKRMRITEEGILIRASEIINWPEIAPDFGLDTRRANGFILVV